MSDDPTPAKLRRTSRSLPIALLRGREVVMAPIREMLAESDINEQKWRVLRVLDEEGPREMSDVAQAACLMLPSLTRISRAMAKDGLIARTADRADGRKAILSITAAGRRLILAHTATSNAIFARLEALYGHDRLEQLLDLLDALRRIDLQPEDRR